MDLVRVKTSISFHSFIHSELELIGGHIVAKALGNAQNTLKKHHYDLGS